MPGKADREVCFLVLVFAGLFCVDAQFGLRESDSSSVDLYDKGQQNCCEQVEGSFAWEFGGGRHGQDGVLGWVVGPSWRVWDGDTSGMACAVKRGASRLVVHNYHFQGQCDCQSKEQRESVHTALSQSKDG
jgi:hypothetical protein